MALTAMWLNARLNKPNSSIVRKSDGEGLGVRISLTGKITFTFRYRFNGKQTSVDLGSYPLMTILQARAQANSYRAELEQGNDPADRKFERGQRYQTFKDYAEAWYADYFSKKVRADMFMGMIRKHLYPHVGEVVVSKSATYEWVRYFRDFKNVCEISDGVFTLMLARASQILKYATKHYQLPYNPVQGITGADFDTKLPVRDRMHSEQELVQLFTIIRDSEVYAGYLRFIQLIMHTGARASEISQAHIRDFDFVENIWSIPKELSKGGQAFFRPLLPQTVAILKVQINNRGPEQPLFPGPEGEPVVQNMHYRCSREIKEWGESYLKGYKTDWVVHDFRRTMRTAVSRWTKNDKIAEMMLGHKVKGIHAVYNRYEYMDEMRVVYRHWLAYLDTLAERSKKEGAI